ncbi:MAG: hypothetical protein ACO1SV_02075 [Fimbriimonas sp.]
MELKAALREQYHAGLAMLSQCVERCPDDLWASGAHPRTYGRIAFHTVYFTHLYLGQTEDDFQPWPGRHEGFAGMWQKPWDLEPYELPEDAEAYSRQEILVYIGYLDGLIDPTVDGLDLDSPSSGFSWYRTPAKLSHELMNLRHLQGHVGQLSELLMARNIDIDWIGD